MNDDVLIVVSHYAARGTSHLQSLLSNLSKVHKNILIVINDDQINKEYFDFFCGFQAIYRPNIGMNIGGWNEAYQQFPNFKFYIFLQDECVVLREDFIAAYVKELSRVGIGMTGETINYKWDREWGQIINSPLNYHTNIIFNGSRLSRVQNYLNLLGQWGISPGVGGRHLRSLVWGLNDYALKGIGKFPIGIDKEQCIAAEIAVSKKVEQLGLGVTQISQTPFYFFQHEEWLSNGMSKK